MPFLLTAKSCLRTAAACLFLGSAPATATTFRFDANPFAGTNVLDTPGWQFVGNELSMPAFDFTRDVISIDPSVFKTSKSVDFYTGLARNLPAGGFNFIVVQDIDADGNIGNGILNNAGLSANLIADRYTVPTPGFFVYFNSVLNLNRLVYSPDLSSPTSDLKIVARFTGQTGLGAADALQRFSASNFAATVPEPTAWAMLITGFGLIGAVMRRRTMAATVSC